MFHWDVVVSQACWKPCAVVRRMAGSRLRQRPQPFASKWGMASMLWTFSVCVCFSSFLSTHIHIYIHTRYNYYVMSYYIILYYVILCYVSLCYVILYHIMLCYITLYYIILHYITLYYMIYIHIYLRIYLRRYFIGED